MNMKRVILAGAALGILCGATNSYGANPWVCTQGRDPLTNDNFYVLSQADELGGSTVMNITIDSKKKTPIVALTGGPSTSVDVDADNAAMIETPYMDQNVYVTPRDEMVQSIKLRFGDQSKIQTAAWVRSSDGNRLLSRNALQFLKTFQKNGDVVVQYLAGGAPVEAKFTAGSTDCVVGSSQSHASE